MKINVKNTEKITEELNAFQKRCTARTVTAMDIQNAVIDIERKFSRYTQKSKVGLSVRVNLNNERMPKAYKYTAQGTKFIVERFASGWFLTYLYRGNCEGGKVFDVDAMPKDLLSEIKNDFMEFND